MAYFIEKDSQGRKIYRGFLSSKETERADLLLGYLQEEIPNIEKELKSKYNDSVLYKYYYGEKLSELINQYEITEKERLYFWKEIENFATDKKSSRVSGKKSKTYSLFEQCYELYQFDLSIVTKLSWRQWAAFFERVVVREDKRVFDWVGKKTEKIKEDEWRSFGKILNYYLKDKDTSVFDEQEIFEIYDMLFLIAQEWIRNFQVFSKEKPKSAKITNKRNWELKFYEQCLKHRRVNKKITQEDCALIFRSLMY